MMNYFIEDFWCKKCGSPVAVMIHERYAAAGMKKVVRCLGCLAAFRAGDNWTETDMTKPIAPNPPPASTDTR